MTQTRTIPALATLAACALAAAPPAAAQTYTFKTLATLAAATANPYGGLTLSGGRLYGTGYGDGLANFGAVYSVPVGGGVVSTLATFDGVGSHGAGPQSGLTLSGSALYGTTSAGGTGGLGMVFSVPTVGGAASMLASFDGSHGASPVAGLTPGGTTLYGTTSGGGTDGQGTVFSLPLGGGTPTTLASFNGGNGGTPNAALLLSGTTLFGTTDYGGASGLGTVFSFNTANATFTTLASFSGANGANPYAGLTLSADGQTLYGTTQFGGANGLGALFAVPLGGGTPTPLVSFSGASNGSYPLAGLTLSADGKTLFGVTQDGGSAGDGTVFAFSPATTAFATLATFAGPNGANPLAALTLGAGGVLYGTTSAGGDAAGDGVVFALTPTPEPSAWLALGLGAFGLGALRCRARGRRNQN